ncbi:hypothetical protein C0Q70_17341 [Pomacea canaliculata]|uniref:C1q domain-containing protein n=2 Tax=Pomacea canaliculata TaxID=400727 RepID=A0A2T7NK51_POMCA|nr:uncharacterized protein LOC112575466 isoform X3 [Pomacea canaliculata]PVD21543.1 hypothetical protein C0Q70_17341 [Pomacea canaliculata]
MVIIALAVLVTLTFTVQTDSKQQSDSNQSTLWTLEDSLSDIETQSKNFEKSFHMDTKSGSAEWNSTMPTEDHYFHDQETETKAVDSENGTTGCLLSTSQDALTTNGSKAATECSDDAFLALKKKVDALEQMIGRLTREAHFMATFSGEFFVISDGKLVFDVVLDNTGNAYNDSEGTFVAPFPGLYVFTVQILAPGEQDLGLQLLVSGTMVTRSRVVTRNDASLVLVYMVHLEAGEDVYVYNHADCSFYGSLSSFFSGWLVKSD